MTRVAYLVNQYPSVSHTFIRREIAALERAGIEVHRFSIRASADGFVDPDDHTESTKTEVLLHSPAEVLAHTLLVALSKPISFIRTILIALASAIRSPLGLKHFVYVAQACWLLRRCARRDINHLHAHFGTNPAAVARYCRRLGGPRYSFTIHGPDEWDSSRGYQLAEKAIDAEFVACISHYTGAQLRRFLPTEHWPKVQIVRCGVDSLFLDQELASTSHSNNLVFVGRLSPQKGVPLLVDAFSRIAPDYPDARLVLCGDGELRSEIEQQVSDCGLQGRVEITGWIDAATVREHLLAARAVAMASFGEGLPVAIMEAFALGRPVIATSIAGIPELVKPGVNGWLVPAGDLDSLAAAIRECFDSDERSLRVMGEHGRAAVAAQHNIDAAVAPLIERFTE